MGLPLRKLLISVLAGAALLLAAFPAFAQEQHKQEPPAFSSGYRLPVQTFPAPRAPIFAWVDVSVLVAALALAAYFSVTRRSRTGIRALSVCCLAYFGFYRQGCICPVGSVQNVALAMTHSGYALPVTVGLFFLLPLLTALFFGRVFCAAVCPLGALQDLLLLRPVRVAPAVEQTLSLLPYAYLGAGLLFASTGASFVICKYDPFVGVFRLAAPVSMIALGGVFLALSTVVGRPYCRFLCPYGVLLRWASMLARWKPEVAPVRCVNCHLCASTCPFGALRPSVAAMEIEPLPIRRRRAARILATGPAIVAALAALGWLGAPMLATVHPVVAHADLIWTKHQAGRAGVAGTVVALAPDPSEMPVLHEAALIRRKFFVASALFGGWLGLVVWLRLLALSRRDDAPFYVADPAACLACARCYGLCPGEVKTAE
ncbi:MAG: 4Fe-4S binding protein [Capsulimonadaceae bacterium]|nr:4Fe-4S binding protein [Capsulimonadaceae bacterium]